MLPDFIVVGAQKSGTSTLAYHLRGHPDIYMPEGEVHFFYTMAKGRYERGVNWYEQVFEGARSGQIVGEKTPTYSYLPGVEKRIYDLIPDVKLVWVLRNPIDRAYSNYWHAVRKGVEHMSFEKAVKKEDERVEKNIWKGYLRRSLYADQVERYLHFFDRGQMLFLRFEEMKSNTETVLEQTFDFLGVDSRRYSLQSGIKKNVTYIPWSITLRYATRKFLGTSRVAGLVNRMNKRSRAGYPPMDPGTRSYLRDIFREPNRRLEALTGLDVSAWK